MNDFTSWDETITRILAVCATRHHSAETLPTILYILRQILHHKKPNLREVGS